MCDPLRKALGRHRTLSIIGLSKNAGKTTVFNRLLDLLEDMPLAPGLTSIGRDGEATDVVTGTAKPGIWVRSGSLVATAADLLRLGDVTPEILHATGIHTPLGEVVVFRALTDGSVQLAGPSMSEQLVLLTETLQALGAGIVLIDGAVSRRSLAAPSVSEATILCVGASYSPDMDVVLDAAAHATQLLMLPQSDGANPRRHVIEGAATDAVVERLPIEDGDEIAVQDSSRVLVTLRLYERLEARGVRFTVARATTLCCVCVNPFSASGADFPGDAFLERMQAALPVPVLNVQEEIARE